MVQVIRSQALHLQPIDKNPGLLPVKEGQAVVSHDTWTVIKILDLRLIYNELELNIDKYVKLKDQVQSCFNIKSFNSDFIEVESQTDYNMNITIEKYKQLIPSVRAKRGLINPLGSLIKTITGNLDNDDAVMYEKLIHEVKTKQDALSKKITIVTEMVGTFTKIANSTKNNFIQIEESIQDINRSLNESKLSQTSNKIIHIYNIFIHNFQTLYIRLNEIEMAIAFGKVKLLHQSIVDTDEFIVLLKEIEKTEKLVYPAKLENIVRIEQCIEMKAYLKQNQIKFIMHIPLIRNEVFNYFKLIPLPVHNRATSLTTFILPKYPYVLVKGLKAKPLSQSCREIDEARFLCFENDVSPLIEDNCINELMKFSTNISSCHPVPVTIDDVKADLIQPNRWIIYVKTETLLTKYCENEITQETISGTYILTMNDDCQVKIKELNIKRHQSQGKDVIYRKFPVINLPKIITSPSDEQRKPINLNGIDLADIQFLNYVLQKSGSEIISSENDHSALDYKSVSIGNIVFCVIIVICLLLLAFKHRIKKLCKTSKIRENPHPSDNLELTEGGVMLPSSTHRAIFNAE